jgi:site-specific recombinase XerD
MPQEWIERFLSQYSSPGSRRVYRADLEDLVRFVQRRFSVEFPALAEEHALAWRAHLEARSLAPSTIARKIAVLKGFYTYLLDLDEPLPGLPPKNPFRRIRPPRFDRSVGKTPAPDPEGVRRLLSAIGSRSPRARRDLLITLLLFNQGLRVAEVARLERSHILAHGGRSYLSLVGKGGSEIRSVLPEDVALLLSRHLRALPPDCRFVFTRMDQLRQRPVSPPRPLTTRTIHERLKNYAGKAGLNPVLIRPHSGRVFFITQSYLKTRDLERVARAVGHRELATTRRYLRLGSALEDHPATLLHLCPPRAAGR